MTAFVTFPSEVEDALIGLLKAALADVRDIAGLTQEDFNDDDQIVTQTPAIRMFFNNEPFTKMSGPTGQIYESEQAWVILCGSQSPRDFATERKGALELAGRVSNLLAGTRLVLPSQSQPPQIFLTRLSLFQAGADGTWYALEISVESISQFTGSGE